MALVSQSRRPGNGILDGFRIQVARASMRILLLGKDGQVGWQLQRSLAPHGEVVACGRRECDLSDLTKIRSLVREVRPAVIVNAAAAADTARAAAEPGLLHRINAELPAVLAEESRRLGGLLVHYSCARVFDGTKKTAYEEGDTPNPQTIFGQSKLAGEQGILALAGKSLIFRTDWVFGARGESYVKTILRLARQAEALAVPANQFGSPTPAAMIATVTGVVMAQLRCGRLMKTGENRLYHLAAARPASCHEFARAIVGQAGLVPGFSLRLRPAAIEALPPAAQSASRFSLDCARLEADTGLQMPDWLPYLQRMLQLLALKRNGY